MKIKITNQIKPYEMVFTVEEMKRKTKGIIVSVCDGHIRIAYNHGDKGPSPRGSGFWSFNSFTTEICSYRDTFQDFLRDGAGGNGQLYYFETMKEFCEEALKNGWEFPR